MILAVLKYTILQGARLRRPLCSLQCTRVPHPSVLASWQEVGAGGGHQLRASQGLQPQQRQGARGALRSQPLFFRPV